MNFLGNRIFNAVAWLRNLKDSEAGQDLVEYSLLATLIALACIAGVKHVATAVSTVFNNVSSSLA
ncbi:MAG: Flp family type IVb pilin [Terracidiphilus sp.]|jgi:Flp pilus assembly pilin Flp